MALFDRFAPLIKSHEVIKAAGVDPFGVRMDRVLSPTEAIVKGRRTLLAGTNNYLGLTFDAGCIAAARSAMETFGTGTTGSAIANGSYGRHPPLPRLPPGFF